MEQPEHSGLDASGVECVDSLYERHRRPLYDFIRRVIRNAADAQDILGDVFLHFIQEVESGRLRLSDDPARPADPEACAESARLRVWLFRAAANQVINLCRKRSRRSAREEHVWIMGRPQAPPGPARILARKELEARIFRTLELLDRDKAEIILLLASGFDYHEIAEELGRKTNSVGPTIARARRAFALAWEDPAQTKHNKRHNTRPRRAAGGDR